MKAKRTRSTTSKKAHAQKAASSGVQPKTPEPARPKPASRSKRPSKAPTFEAEKEPPLVALPTPTLKKVSPRAAAQEPKPASDEAPAPQPQVAGRPKRSSKQTPPVTPSPEPTPTPELAASGPSTAARAKRASKKVPSAASTPKQSAPVVPAAKPAVVAPQAPAPISKVESEILGSEPITQRPAPPSKSPVPAVAPPAQPLPSQKREFHIPKILFEGDEPSPQPPPASKLLTPVGPPISEARATVLSSAPPTEKLPEAYGTGRLFLTARDPHCFYSHWDLTREQLAYYNKLSIHGHLVLRLHLERAGEKPTSELHVHPESRDWFLHVDRPGAPYIAELGCYLAPGQWRTIAISDPAVTPVPSPRVEPTPPRFVHFRPQPITPGREFSLHVPAGETRVEDFASQTAAATGRSGQMFPARTQAPQPSEWTGRSEEFRSSHEPFTTAPEAYSPVFERARFAEASSCTATEEQELKTLMGVTFWREQFIDSAQFAELINVPQAQVRAVSSAEKMQIIPEMAPSSAELAQLQAVTSPGAAELPPAPEFWFNVNAELVIYGATEPDALVTIGGRTIRLRPDGTFSYRFSLPDGDYALPIQARAAHGDTRRAELTFRRTTQFTGEVGHHPQDPALQPPQVENVS